MNSLQYRKRALRSWRNSLFILTCAAALALTQGCGGGSSGGSGAPADNLSMTGTDLEVGIGVVSAKSTIAAYVPFSVLNQMSPTGKPLFHPLTGGPVAVPGMGLYSSSVISGKTVTTKFFTDAAGTNQVGTLTVAGSETIGTTYTYPVSFHATGSITGGNIPLTADFTVNFTDALGANTLQGKLGLSKDNIAMTFNMGLNDAGAVASTGTIQSTYSYNFQGTPVPVTTTLSNLTGGPATKINGDAVVSATVPGLGTQAGTGTGSLDLVNGAFTLNVTGGALNGLLTAFNGGNDTLSVSDGAGFSTLINKVSGFSLSSLLKVVATGGSGYQAPVAVQGTGSVSVEGTLGDGEMVGFSRDTSNKTTGYYWSSPTAAPQVLVAPNSGTQTAAHGIATYSKQTVIVGSYVDKSGTIQPCYWIDTTGTHTFSAYAAGSGLQYGGAIQAISPNGNTMVGFSFTQAFVQQPIAFMGGTFYPLPTDGRSGNLRAVAVDNNNDVLGAGDGSAPTPGTWRAISVDTTSNSITAPFKALPQLKGVTLPLLAAHMSDNGVVVGGDGFNAMDWGPSDSFVAHALPNGDDYGVSGYAVNHAGTQAAGLGFATSPALTVDLAYWPTLTTAPVDVTTKLGSAAGKYQNLTGFFILDDGSLIALATTTSTTGVQYVYIKKQ